MRCPGCGEPSVEWGATCDYECYIHAIYLMRKRNRLTDQDEDDMLVHVEYSPLLLTLEEQPWYERMIGSGF